MSSSSTSKPVTKRKPSQGQRNVQGGTGEANRRAVAVLEVLGGLCTPADAAVALGIALPRYYQLEVRALEGMVRALEPRSLGKQPSPEKRLIRLEKELEQARRECSRHQALVRITQRSVGLKPAAAAANGPAPAKDRTGRRKRKPTVRALSAAAVLRVLSKNPREGEDSTVKQDKDERDGLENPPCMEGPASVTAGSGSKEERSA